MLGSAKAHTPIWNRKIETRYEMDYAEIKAILYMVLRSIDNVQSAGILLSSSTTRMAIRRFLMFTEMQAPYSI